MGCAFVGGEEKKTNGVSLIRERSGSFFQSGKLGGKKTGNFDWPDEWDGVTFGDADTKRLPLSQTENLMQSLCFNATLFPLNESESVDCMNIGWIFNWF